MWRRRDCNCYSCVAACSGGCAAYRYGFLCFVRKRPIHVYSSSNHPLPLLLLPTLNFCTPPLPVSVPTARGLLHTNLPQPPPQHVLALPFGPFLLALPAVRSDRELQEVAEQEIINTRSLAVISSPPLPASLATRACIEVRLGFIAREGFQAAVGLCCLGLCCHFLFRVWQTTYLHSTFFRRYRVFILQKTSNFSNQTAANFVFCF